MKTTVETYHKIDIYFDTESEIFGCNIKTDCKTSKSFAAVKSWIRQYEKENDTFEPFWVIKNPENNHWANDKRLQIVGVNKEGLFVYLSEQTGKKNQLSKYDAEHWILEKPELERELGILAILKSESDDARKAIDKQEAKIVSMTKTLYQYAGYKQ